MIFLLRMFKYLKALASLVGSIATALSLRYTENETLTIVVIISTAIITWAVPNKDFFGEAQDESVQPPDEDDEHDAVNPDDVDVDEFNLPVDAMHEVTPSYGDPDAGPYHGDAALDAVDPHRTNP